VAHGLADVWLTNPDRGHRHTETAQPTGGVAECGKCDASALPGKQQPIPAKVNRWNELPAIRSNPHSYRDPAASMANSPF
jgi:hypothetical protein